MIQKIFGIPDRILSFSKVLILLCQMISLCFLPLQISNVIGRRHSIHCSMGDVASVACLKPYFWMSGICFLGGLFLMLYMAKMINSAPIFGNHPDYPGNKTNYIAAIIVLAVLSWMFFGEVMRSFSILDKSYREDELEYFDFTFFTHTLYLSISFLVSSLFLLNKLRLIHFDPNQRIV